MVFPQGDLKQFLRISKSKDEKLKSQPLSTKQKVRMGISGPQGWARSQHGHHSTGALMELCLWARPHGKCFACLTSAVTLQFVTVPIVGEDTGLERLSNSSQSWSLQVASCGWVAFV